MNQIIGAASPKNGPSHTHSSNGSTPQKPGKELRMLALFAAGHSLNRFQAEQYGDHCLPTTISDLQKRYGIEFKRQQENVPTRFGRPTRVSRYWLEGDHLEKARQFVRREMLGKHRDITRHPVIGDSES